jgi:hypothetical protein
LKVLANKNQAAVKSLQKIGWAGQNASRFIGSDERRLIFATLI